MCRPPLELRTVSRLKDTSARSSLSTSRRENSRSVHDPLRSFPTERHVDGGVERDPLRRTPPRVPDLRVDVIPLRRTLRSDDFEAARKTERRGRRAHERRIVVAVGRTQLQHVPRRLVTVDAGDVGRVPNIGANSAEKCLYFRKVVLLGNAPAGATFLVYRAARELVDDGVPLTLFDKPSKVRNA